MFDFRDSDNELVAFSSQPYTVILKKDIVLELEKIPDKKRSLSSWIKKKITGKEYMTAKSNSSSSLSTLIATTAKSISDTSPGTIITTTTESDSDTSPNFIITTTTSTNHSSAPNSSLHMKTIQRHDSTNFSLAHAILDSTSYCLGFSAPHLFLVLPADLTSWDDMNPNTHRFRLYFMCDSRSSLSSNTQPQHIHLSGHQGYDIIRSQEFFQLFGQYTLALLELVKYGFLKGARHVPSLDSCEVLRCCLGDPVKHQLSKININPYVDHAIIYIQSLLLSPRSESLLDSRETKQITAFLQREGDDSGLGGLYRTVYASSGYPMRWLCSTHSLEYSMTKTLQKYVYSQQGALNQQLATIDIPLASNFPAEALAQELKNSCHVYDINLRLKWDVSMKEVQDLLRTFARSGAVAVHIDGTRTSDEKLFASLIIEKTDTQGSEYSMVTNILEWRCSHVTGIKGDRDVAILDMASLRFPSVMISLSLDITTLTERGLACVRNIFQQSPLENLRIHCTSIGPIMERHLGPALLAIPCLICHAPLLQLSLENIYVPQEQDWDLIIKVVDFSRLMCLSLVNKDEYTIQSSYRSMLIDGVCILDHENDLQQGLFPGFLDCYVESAGHNNMSGRTILKANVLHQAIMRNNLGKSVSRPYRVYRLRERSGVQEVILPTMEKDILSRIGQLRQFWSGKSGQLLAELVVKEKPSCKVVVTIGEKLTMSSVGGAVMQGASDTIESEAYIKVLEWDLEHVSKPLSDENAAVLDRISSQRPLVLKHFALNITFLTDHGLASLRNVLQRSRLKSVRVNCGPIQPEVRETLYLLLKSMNKSTLHSLILEGNNVDGWLRLWGTIEELPRWQLKQFEMTGKIRWQALDISNMLLVKHLIQQEDPPQIQMSGFVCTEWNDWKIFEAAAGSGRTQRLQVPWTTIRSGTLYQRYRKPSSW
ncbi:hypothetical protein BG000_001626 [Podila horticola]|nr:hypothetical protein BG000_001626 [Podila horticola]